MTTEAAPKQRRPKATNQDMPNQTRRLTREFSTYDATTITHLLNMMMANLEDGLMQSGAMPGVDDTFRDLANWAMPMIAAG